MTYSPPKMSPTATATIEPIGLAGIVPREHTMKVEIRFIDAEPRYASRAHVLGMLNDGLGELVAEGAEGVRVTDLTVARKKDRTSTPTQVVIGLEASVVSPDKPTIEAIEKFRVALLREGYALTVREKRECHEKGCSTFASVPWNQPQTIPREWHSPDICGRHNYRTCARCQSVYVLTSQNAAGQNPSVHCEVCGSVIVEWGSSKIWSAVLVARSAPRV